MDDNEELKQEAARACLDVYLDYTEEEVKKFTPPSVQSAWHIGAKIREVVRKREARRIKKFTI